jgi:hypothetical protein
MPWRETDRRQDMPDLGERFIHVLYDYANGLVPLAPRRHRQAEWGGRTGVDAPVSVPGLRTYEVGHRGRFEVLIRDLKLQDEPHSAPRHGASTL